MDFPKFMIKVYVVLVLSLTCNHAVCVLSCSMEGNSTSENEVTVCVDAINCTHVVTLDGALAQLRSDSTLVLCSGTHTIREFHLIRDLINITIRGKSVSDTTITCHDGIGLAFFNISRLAIENVAIIGCGMRDNATQAVESAIKQVVDTFFQIPSATNIAVILGNCHHVHFNQVTIADSEGLGLVGINVMGVSILKAVEFRNNTYALCRIGSLNPSISYSQGGGGAFLFYHNYKEAYDFLHRDAELNISQSTFNLNGECSPASFVELYYGVSLGLQKIGYLVGGGGGLTVMLAQSFYQVNVAVTHSRFFENHALYGGGAHIGIFNTATHFQVVFSNCVFHENGVPTETFSPRELSRGGSGIAIINDLVRPGYPQPIIRDKHGFVVIEDTDLTRNSAYQGSGLFVYSTYASVRVDNDFTDVTQVHITNCRFQNNIGALGPAMYAIEVLTAKFRLLVQLTNVTVKNNTLAPLDGAKFRSVLESSAAVHTRAFNVVFKGNCSIIHNVGTGIYGRRTYFNVSVNSTLVISGNIGAFGGGMTLVFYSFIFLQHNSTLKLHDNDGRVAGGALYIHLRDDPVFPYDDCFIYYITLNAVVCNPVTGCNELRDLGIKVDFYKNRAPLGSTIYGSTLSTCSWVRELRRRNDYPSSYNSFDIIRENLPGVFSFDKPTRSIEEVSTLPVDLKLPITTYSAMPGQFFRLNVSANDRFSQYVPTVVTSTVLSEHNASSQVGASGYLLVRDDVTSIPVKLSGREGDKVFVELYSIESFADTQFNVTLLSCAPGFAYSNATAECICDPELTQRGIECNAESGNLAIPNHLWVGPVSEYVTDTVELVEECVLDYCQPDAKTIVPPDYDSQCNDGYSRTGILCGKCKDGYSVVLGTNRCLKCTNTYLLLLLVFLVAGIILILCISLLHITVTKGYLNTVLLYCNMISVYLSAFTFETSISGRFQVIQFLNLNFGIEACFFDGMNALVLVGLQLVFPAYLFLLMGLMVLLARTRCFKWLAHPQADVVRVLATLLILCYSSVLETCIEILGVIRMDTLSGDHLVRWVVDPTVTYFHGWHGVLGAIAVFLVVTYITIFPLLVLFPKRTYQLPYIKKLKPLFDALYCPFEDKLRFWLGVRLLLRIPPLVFAFFTQYPLNVFLLAIFLLTIQSLQAAIRPFKNLWVNNVDAFLLLNAIFLSLGSLYFDTEDDGSDDTKTIANSYFALLYYSSCIVFLIILLVYIFARLPERYQQAIKDRLYNWRGSRKRSELDREPAAVQDLTTTTGSASCKVTRSTVSILSLEGRDLRASLIET